MILETGTTGIPLKDIIKKLGDKSYEYIECRCKWKDGDAECDEFIGCCSYDNKTKTLTPLDGDIYTLDELYVEWEEYINDGQTCLTVWEEGEITHE